MGSQGSRTTLRRMWLFTRLLRYAVYISILCMLWWIFSNFSFVQIEEGDGSIIGISGNRRILVERFSPGREEILRGDVLVFAMLNQEDQQIFRVSRVLAVPGDMIGAGEQRYTVNGKPVKAPLSRHHDLQGLVPEGFYLMVNDNPLSTYSDSLRLGLIDQQWIVGRFLSELPF